uniref:GHMP_kinases_N domain-containing protein n=1 Tax=Angiostrongylus cantonensis TaxID=6313 RepID=A0A158P7S1_ANGCA
MEYMCAQQGYSVLNESLLESSRILILLLGASSESFPLGAAFKPTLKILETPWIVPDYPIAHTILNANRLATNSEQGVWICGTDAQWKIADLPKFAFDPDEMAAFYFQDCLPLIEYEYLSDIKKEQTKITKLVMVDTLQGTTLRLMLKMIARDGGQYSTIILMTLMALVKYYGVKLDILNEIESCSYSTESVPRCSRALMLAAEYLALAAQGRGGLRSGPAANPSFTYVFDQIKAEPNGEQVRELFRIVREQWLHSETEMIRAARHLEAAAQIYTRLEVERICQRVDLFGGWLDTPPITLHAKPSAVVNMAILVDDMKPITCKVSRCCIPGITVKSEETTISFETSRSILDSHNKPGNPGALLCACLVCVGIPKRPDDNLPEVLQNSFSSTGLQIECHSSLPHGSGLGTSSILAAAVIRALWLTAGVNHSEKNVCHAVLMVEQLLTTGGGWQDQVGCLYPGIKKGIFSEEESSIDVEQIPISQYFEDDINRRMALIYTGKTRLAKNLLQEVIRGWYSGGPTRDVIASLENNVELFSDALRAGHMPCDLIDLYYEAKKALATGCEPEVVTSLIFRLKTEKLIDTAWLAGAGGGGFLYAWLRKDVTADQIRTYISDCGCFEMSVHTITIDNSPMNVYLT